MDIGVAKFEVFYAGSGTWQNGRHSCGGCFQDILDGYNKDSAGTQGGNLLANEGEVYYLLSIDPQGDQQTNGTYPAPTSKAV